MNAIIDSLNACGAAFAGFALPMLAQSALLIALLWALDLTLRRRIRATIRYAFWLLVLVKLLLPPSFALPTGAGYWLALAKTQSAPPMEMIPAPPIISESAPPLITTFVNNPNNIAVAPIHSTLSIQGVLFIVWFALASGIGIWVVWRLGIVLGVIGQSAEAPAAVQSMADACRRQLEIRRAISVRCASIGSPAICGLLRPVILISPALANELGEAEMRAVLLHEMVHYKRADLWINHAQILLQIVYWYNPLVWLANASIRRVREQAVDEMVLVEMGAQSRAYPETLLHVAKLSSGQLAPALGFLGILEPGRGLPERLRRIMELPNPRTARIGARGLAAVLLLGLLAIPMACRQITNNEVSSADAVRVSVVVDGKELHLTPAFQEKFADQSIALLESCGYSSSRDNNTNIARPTFQQAQQQSHLTLVFPKAREIFVPIEKGKLKVKEITVTLPLNSGSVWVHSDKGDSRLAKFLPNPAGKLEATLKEAQADSQENTGSAAATRLQRGARDMDKFKAFMESPPIISKIVYSHYYPGRTDKYPPDYHFARWQPDAFFGLKSHNEQDVRELSDERLDWNGHVTCVFDDKWWTLDAAAPGPHRILDERIWNRKANPEIDGSGVAIPVSSALDQFSFLMNMGVEHARIGAIHWIGDGFDYTNHQADAAGLREWRLSGRLLPDAQGRAKELDLDLVLIQPRKPAPDTYQWAIDYSYESPRPISYLPSRITTRWVDAGGVGPEDHILDEFLIMDLDFADRPLSPDLFDPAPWHPEQVHELTNNHPHVTAAYREDWSNKNLRQQDPIWGGRMSADEVREWEAVLERYPEDFDARRHLLIHYFGHDGSNERREAHEKHALWVIEHHPEVLGGDPYLSLNPTIDGAAYAQGKAQWLRHVEENPKNAAILGHAAEYFQIYETKRAEDLFKRAQALEPVHAEWAEALGELYYRQGDGTNGAAKALREFEKVQNPGRGHPFETLDRLAKTAFDAGDLEKASSYATELLQRIEQNRDSWNRGNAIQDGNLVLGEVALSEGKMEQAKQYLLESGKTPGSPQLNSFGPNMSLAKALLEKGETNTVLEYFDECRKFWTMGSNKKQLDTWATTVKAGQIPDFGANLLY